MGGEDLDFSNDLIQLGLSWLIDRGIIDASAGIGLSWTELTSVRGSALSGRGSDCVKLDNEQVRGGDWEN